MLTTIPVEGNSPGLSRIGLGAMPLSLHGRPAEADAKNIIRRYVEAGGNFIDTANVYCRNEQEIGHNEYLIRQALKNQSSDSVYVATKGGLRMSGDSWAVDGSPAWLRMSCETSLMNLNASNIFLYQLHAPDPDIDILESLGEMMRMQAEGMIQHIGLSNLTRKQLRRAVETTTVFSLQNSCSVFNQTDLQKGMIDLCKQNNVLYIAHSPVGGHHNHTSLIQHPLLEEVAWKYSTSNYVIALAWLLAQEKCILPIPGASKISSIEGSLAACDLNLEQEDIELLNQVGSN